MEKQVVHRNFQEVDFVDLNNMQEYVAKTFGDLLLDAVFPDNTYGGFEASFVLPTNVVLQPGRVYSGRRIHAKDLTTNLNLAQYLPLVTKRIVAIIAIGQPDTLTDEQQRDFLIDADTGATEPRTVAMTKANLIQVTIVQGAEAPDPLKPTIEAGLQVVAYVTLGTSGILSLEGGKPCPSVGANSERIDELNAWRETVGPAIQTVASDVSSLANQTRSLAAHTFVQQVAFDVARLKEISGLPATYSSYGADRFLNVDQTDTAYVAGNLAKVEEGVRFNDEAITEVELSLFSQFETKVKTHSGGLILPAYTEITRKEISGIHAGLAVAGDGYQSLNQYTQINHNMVQKQMSRQRIRYGTPFEMCTNNAHWQTGSFDSATGVFYRNGETFKAELTNVIGDYPGHLIYRLTQFWTDTYSDPYWDKVTTTTVIAGSMCAQTFLNSQEGWLTSVEISFSAIAATGGVTVVIVECDQGIPNPKKVIATSTVAQNQLNTGWCKVPFKPTFLQAGKRYAVMPISGANHLVYMIGGQVYGEGTFFYTTDGEAFIADVTKDMALRLNFAKFNNAQTEVDLNPLSLSGGILALDIMADMVTPKSTEGYFSVQIGGAWKRLSSLDTKALIGLPPLLPLRFTFVGTEHASPGLTLGGSRVRATRPRATYTHASKVINLPAPSQTIHVTIMTNNFVEADHDLNIRLKIDGALVVPSSVVDTNTDRPKRKAVFNLPAVKSSFQIVLLGATNSPQTVFVAEERVFVAF